LCATLYADAVEDGLCLLEVPDVIRCVLLCMLKAVECRLYSLEVLEAMRGVLLSTLEALEALGCSRCSRHWRRCRCRS